MGLLKGYLGELKASGKGTEAEKRWTPCFQQFTEFLKHDDAARITRADVLRWKDELMLTRAAKTVRDVNLASLKAVLQWAAENDRIKSNPAMGVKVRVVKAVRSREKGYTLQEALVVLKAASDYKSPHSSAAQRREHPTLAAAKNWVPWLCAHTGARVSEMTQLRKQDVRCRDGIHFVRITPDAGSVKTGQYRDVPLHPQLIERGFLEFVTAASDGPLFYDDRSNRKGKLHPAKNNSSKLGVWIRSLNIIPAEVDPNHGWRHRMKTVGREAGVDPRVLDAIQGHAARTAGDDYGDVTLKARAMTIGKLPHYDMSERKS